MKKTIKVQVVFFEDVRTTPPYGDMYRPHFVVKGSTDYLGVQFINLAMKNLGTIINSDIELLFNVDYAGLRKDTEFFVMEGAKCVGQGRVL